MAQGFLREKRRGDAAKSSPRARQEVTPLTCVTEDVVFSSKETLTTLLSQEELDGKVLQNIYEEPNHGEKLEEPDVLEITYMRDGWECMEIVYFDTLLMAEAPRICVPVEAVNKMHRQISVLKQKADNALISLRSCRHLYLQKLNLLRTQLHQEALVELVGIDEDAVEEAMYDDSISVDDFNEKLEKELSDLKQRASQRHTQVLKLKGAVSKVGNTFGRPTFDRERFNELQDELHDLREEHERLSQERDEVILQTELCELKVERLEEEIDDARAKSKKDLEEQRALVREAEKSQGLLEKTLRKERQDWDFELAEWNNKLSKLQAESSAEDLRDVNLFPGLRSRSHRAAILPGQMPRFLSSALPDVSDDTNIDDCVDAQHARCDDAAAAATTFDGIREAVRGGMSDARVETVNASTLMPNATATEVTPTLPFESGEASGLVLLEAKFSPYPPPDGAEEGYWPLLVVIQPTPFKVGEEGFICAEGLTHLPVSQVFVRREDGALIHECILHADEAEKWMKLAGLGFRVTCRKGKVRRSDDDAKSKHAKQDKRRHRNRKAEQLEATSDTRYDPMDDASKREVKQETKSKLAAAMKALHADSSDSEGNEKNADDIKDLTAEEVDAQAALAEKQLKMAKKAAKQATHLAQQLKAVDADKQIALEADAALAESAAGKGSSEDADVAAAAAKEARKQFRRAARKMERFKDVKKAMSELAAQERSGRGEAPAAASNPKVAEDHQMLAASSYRASDEEVRVFVDDAPEGELAPAAALDQSNTLESVASEVDELASPLTLHAGDHPDNSLTALAELDRGVDDLTHGVLPGALPLSDGGCIDAVAAVASSNVEQQDVDAFDMSSVPASQQHNSCDKDYSPIVAPSSEVTNASALPDAVVGTVGAVASVPSPGRGYTTEQCDTKRSTSQMETVEMAPYHDDNNLVLAECVQSNHSEHALVSTAQNNVSDHAAHMPADLVGEALSEVQVVTTHALANPDTIDGHAEVNVGSRVAMTPVVDVDVEPKSHDESGGEFQMKVAHDYIDGGGAFEGVDKVVTSGHAATHVAPLPPPDHKSVDAARSGDESSSMGSELDMDSSDSGSQSSGSHGSSWISSASSAPASAAVVESIRETPGVLAAQPPDVVPSPHSPGEKHISPAPWPLFQMSDGNPKQKSGGILSKLAQRRGAASINVLLENEEHFDHLSTDEFVQLHAQVRRALALRRAADGSNIDANETFLEAASSDLPAEVKRRQSVAVNLSSRKLAAVGWSKTAGSGLEAPEPGPEPVPSAPVSPQPEFRVAFSEDGQETGRKPGFLRSQSSRVAFAVASDSDDEEEGQLESEAKKRKSFVAFDETSAMCDSATDLMAEHGPTSALSNVDATSRPAIVLNTNKKDSSQQTTVSIHASSGVDARFEILMDAAPPSGFHGGMLRGLDGGEQGALLDNVVEELGDLCRKFVDLMSPGATVGETTSEERLIEEAQSVEKDHPRKSLLAAHAPVAVHSVQIGFGGNFGLGVGMDAAGGKKTQKVAPRTSPAVRPATSLPRVGQPRRLVSGR
eukprot:TRINITY_DN15498_c0_g2_i1.p1 TRINITY_DN15498_c0_g2~~TRINITY_DN15498_c0_g2_i1.p1  ORF type:complete len:1540 (-),score=288.39 TRINITY_DN15498_c0_g2_i1:262-4881(-)